MIEELSVQNFALIEKAKLEFRSGLNVLTGETGAGKSIIVGALGLLLGSKVESDVIRTGAEETLISGVLDLGPDAERLEWFRENGLPVEDGPLILRRLVRQNKRGACFIQDQPVTRNQLEDLASYLVDLHGQHEHQSLFVPENHRRHLDRFLGIWEELQEFSLHFSQLNALKKDLESLEADESVRSEEIFRLRQAIEEISEACLVPGEEEELKREKTRLDQFEKLHGAIQSLDQVFFEGRSGALALLRSGAQIATTISRIDGSLEPFAQRLESAVLEVEDLAESFHSYRLSLNFSPEHLEEVNARLALLYGLSKRYGPSVEAMLEHLEQAVKRLQVLENFASVREETVQKMLDQEKKVLGKAALLSEKRLEGALRLQGQILEALGDLGMSKAQFQIAISRRLGESGKPLCGPTGMDSVEFLFSANQGEPLRPLKDIASGGELSRVMLALKSVLSETDNIPILVFDEIDTGIGGEIGNALGRFMKKIARNKQVLCITHLASIASFADHQLKIEKQVEGGRTLTRVTPVLGEDRVKEIARMLSGDSTGDAGLEHARSMLEKNSGRF